MPDYLWAQPEPLATPPAVTQIQTLEFAWLSPENFERLCLRVATVLDRLEDPRLFGKPGQRQFGIDFWGRRSDGVTVYQVKRLKADPTANLLVKSFGKFKKQGARLGSKHFVLCTARPARDPDLLIELDSLRSNNSDHVIDIYDAEKLSDVLRSRPDIVQSFFGTAWVQAFCTLGQQSAGPPAPGATQARNVDAILRGPIRALRLEAVLSEAVSTSDAQRAAELYARLERSLRESGFPAHADRMRELEAGALSRLGDISGAYEIWLDLAINDIEEGSTSPVPGARQKLDEFAGSVSEEAREKHRAVEARRLWYDGPQPALGELVHAFTRLAELKSSAAALVGVWLAECASIDAEASIIREHLDHLQQAASSAPEPLMTRLNIVVAEATGEWQELVRLAETGQLGQDNGGLVLARYGRWLGLNGEPDRAVDAYRKAIQALTHAELLGDVQEALYAIWMLRIRYGPVDEAMEPRNMARTLSGKKRFKGPMDYIAAGLGQIQEAKYPEAHSLLRRALYEAAMGGHMTDEILVTELLGDIYAKADDGLGAIRRYVSAGAAEDAAQIAGQASEPLPLLIEDHRAPWAIASALAVLSANADLMEGRIVSKAIPQLISLHFGTRQAPYSPRVDNWADKAIAALALQLNEMEAESILGLFEPLIKRPAATHRFSDDSMVEVFTGIYRCHPTLRLRAFDDLVNCLGESNVGPDACRRLSYILREDRSQVASVVAKADAGVLDAVVTLALADIDHPAVVDMAIERLRHLLSLLPRNQSSPWSLTSGYGETAIFIRRLGEAERIQAADQFLLLAQSETELEANRGSAVWGIYSLAPTLPDEMRQRLFKEILALTEPIQQPSEIDQMAQQSQHLLSRFTLNFGSGALAQAATITAAQLASSQEDVEELSPLIARALYSAVPEQIVLGMRSLSTIEDEIRPPLDLTLWAQHPDVDVRAAVGRLACQYTGASPTVLQLSADQQMAVRLSIAASLSIYATHAPTAAHDLRARLIADPSAAVRQVAREALIPESAVSTPA